jgi:hypothetical protein
MTLFDFPGRVWFDCGNFVHQYCTVIVLAFGLFITLQKKKCSRKAIDANEGNKLHDSLDGISNTDTNTS